MGSRVRRGNDRVQDCGSTRWFYSVTTIGCPILVVPWDFHSLESSNKIFCGGEKLPPSTLPHFAKSWASCLQACARTSTPYGICTRFEWRLASKRVVRR